MENVFVMFCLYVCIWGLLFFTMTPGSRDGPTTELGDESGRTTEVRDEGGD